MDAVFELAKQITVLHEGRKLAKGTPNEVSNDDVYTLLLAIFLFASPWLFAYSNATQRIDLWASSGLVAQVSRCVAISKNYAFA